MFENQKVVSDIFKLDGNFFARFDISSFWQLASLAFTRDQLGTRIDNTEASSSNLAFDPIFIANENDLERWAS